MLQIECGCGKLLHADDQLVGKRIKCPGCGATQLVQPREPTSNGKRGSGVLLLCLLLGAGAVIFFGLLLVAGGVWFFLLRGESQGSDIVGQATGNNAATDQSAHDKNADASIDKSPKDKGLPKGKGPKDTAAPKDKGPDQASEPAAITMTLNEPMIVWQDGAAQPTLSGAVGYKITSGKPKADYFYICSVIMTNNKGETKSFRMKVVQGGLLGSAPEGSFASAGFKVQMPDAAAAYTCDILVEESAQLGGTPRALVARLSNVAIMGKAPVKKSAP
jgi:hypothetical protein